MTATQRLPPVDPASQTRVLIGDALVTEDDRLQSRINQLIDRLELSIKQSFRTAVAQGRLPQETDPGARANLLLSYVQGRWLRFAQAVHIQSCFSGSVPEMHS